MDKANLELFKQAINEGLSNKYNKIIAEHPYEVVCSERHNLAMRAIIYGKTGIERVWSPKMKHVIAILIAAALLLTSCGIIFRNEIREVFNKWFVKLAYDIDENNNETIKEIYVFSYIPEGYVLQIENTSVTIVRYVYVNDNNDTLLFEQQVINSDYFIDSEIGYSKMYEIEKHEVYYRYSGNYNYYIWNNGKYSIKLRSDIQLSNEEIISIFDGIITK